ncbi:hypothetical protein [Catenulispora pinisilvae]|uniref:hypothetical protein n=1 Tax=Catenulispora pinisilvae TaxID=2705253 RepID=UPI00189202F8|nr:hypothetical protein [Catenulispora pinisilvae]
MPASIPKNPPSPAVHLARAAYWIDKSEALTQHPNTAGKGEACAAIATAHAAIAQAALLAAINTRLAAISRNPATNNKEPA